MHGCGIPKEQQDFAVMGKTAMDLPTNPILLRERTRRNAVWCNTRETSTRSRSRRQARCFAPSHLNFVKHRSKNSRELLHGTVSKLKEAGEDRNGDGAVTQIQDDDPSICSPCTDINSYIQPDKQSPAGLNSGSVHAISGTMLKAVRTAHMLISRTYFISRGTEGYNLFQWNCCQRSSEWSPCKQNLLEEGPCYGQLCKFVTRQ